MGGGGGRLCLAKKPHKSLIVGREEGVIFVVTIFFIFSYDHFLFIVNVVAAFYV